MTCRRCALEIEHDSTFCRFCGTAVRSNGIRRVTRLPLEGRVGGVCAGLAAHLNTDPTIVRLAWVILSIIPGMLIGGVAVYVAAWILMPANELGRSVYRGKRLMRADDGWVAGVCGGVAEYLHIDPTIVRVVAVILAIYPGMGIFGVITYVVLWIIIPPAPLLPMHTAPTRI
jgi:phage shock protein C